MQGFLEFHNSSESPVASWLLAVILGFWCPKSGLMVTHEPTVSAAEDVVRTDGITVRTDHLSVRANGEILRTHHHVVRAHGDAVRAHRATVGTVIGTVRAHRFTVRANGHFVRDIFHFWMSND